MQGLGVVWADVPPGETCGRAVGHRMRVKLLSHRHRIVPTSSPRCDGVGAVTSAADVHMSPRPEPLVFGDHAEDVHRRPRRHRHTHGRNQPDYAGLSADCVRDVSLSCGSDEQRVRPQHLRVAQFRRRGSLAETSLRSRPLRNEPAQLQCQTHPDHRA